jgi:hypothetical protein
VHEIINVALHQEYSLGIIFIFSQWSMCYTTKCDTVEDGLMERALEDNPSGGWVRRLTQRYRVTRVMSEEIGNLVVKVNVKENVEVG